MRLDGRLLALWMPSGCSSGIRWCRATAELRKPFDGPESKEFLLRAVVEEPEWEVREGCRGGSAGGLAEVSKSRLGGLGSFFFFYTRDYAAPASQGGVAS